ncbi:MAG: hypothetical protein PHQ57_02740 [Candidatus Omnitrophica bacterium]|nr:hypothetical protein [Candidatus Omnitrophota bacterium]
MEGKTKFIILALTGILLVSLFLNWQVYNSKIEIERDRNTLKQENASLSSKVEEGIKDNRDLKDKIGSLSKDVERLTRDKDEIQKKIDLLGKEKEDLARKLKAQSQQQMQPAIIANIPAAQETKSVSLPVVNDAYWAGILKAKANLEVQLGNISEKLKSLGLNNEQLKKDKTALELQMKSLDSEKQELKRQLEYNQKSLDNLAQELVREKNDKFQMQGNLENGLSTLKNENAMLKKQLDSLNNQKMGLEDKLAGMDNKVASFEKEKSELENKLRVMDSLVQENISQMGGFKKKLEAAAYKSETEMAETKNKGAVELPAIVVRPKTAAVRSVSSIGLSGKILSVKQESNFVIIDLGEEAGVKLGDSFKVYKDNNKEIATVEVIQLRPDIAACDIKAQTGSISIGDTIK